jgi:hypothetical protein
MNTCLLKPGYERVSLFVTALWWWLVAERVIPWDAGCQWEPNAPEAVLALSDIAGAALAVEAHPDDVD